MPRLKHKVTGVTVSVSDEFAKANPGGWEPADKPEPKAKSEPKK